MILKIKLLQEDIEADLGEGKFYIKDTIDTWLVLDVRDNVLHAVDKFSTVYIGITETKRSKE